MRQLKQPAEQLVFEYDFSARLGASGTIASIAAATVTARELVTVVTPLTIGAQAVSGQKVRLRLDGGTDGETYLVAVRVLDAAGQTHELDAEFVIINFGFEVPTVASPYLSAQAFVERIGLDEAIMLTDTIGSGRIEVQRLANALNDAQSEAEGYLAAKYEMPLSPVPALVTTIVFDLVVARLWGKELPAAVKDRRDEALRKLRDISKGTLVLTGSATLAPATSNPAPVLFTASDRLFSRDMLKGL